MGTRICALFLITIVFFNMIRYEIPYIQYVLFRHYIAKNLCINKDKPKSCCEGKCFRDKQVGKVVNADNDENKDSERSKPALPRITETKEFIFHLINIQTPFPQKITYPNRIQPMWKDVPRGTQFVPPRL